ncbi:FAD/NAD(P)-binding domain-containing protein [Mycena filopes]|nr:FAD/NAD(P)-binding domain-containing protein [Mycena filopes]
MEPTTAGNSPRPLNVAIVGAGLGGLAAAIALRRNGHRVRIFEASEAKSEIGAGITAQRNAVRVLEHLGYCQENVKPIHFDGAEIFNARTGVGRTATWLTPRAEGESDIFCHRSDLYNELKRLATGDVGDGPPAQLLLGHKVLACDPDAGIITLNNGETTEADLVIGADGIRSVVRDGILGEVVKAPASGWSCIRCVFDASTLDDIPELDWLTVGVSGARVVTWTDGGPLRSFFIYKCRSGALVNVVAYHEDPAQDEPTWTPTVTRAEILEKFEGFHPKFLRVFDLPTDSPILRWQLRAVPLLPTWIRGRAALLGDAAHGTLPLLGQGAAMAFEEAVALGCLLPPGTRKEDVPARLEGYQALRKERGEYVNVEAVEQAAVLEKRGSYFRSREMQALILEYDTVKVTQEYYEAHFRVGT